MTDDTHNFGDGDRAVYHPSWGPPVRGTVIGVSHSLFADTTRQRLSWAAKVAVRFCSNRHQRNHPEIVDIDATAVEPEDLVDQIARLHERG